MPIMLNALIAFVFTALVAVVHATPAISIGDMHEFIEADARTVLKRISNSGTSTAFVRIEMKEIVYENGKPIERDIAPIAMTEEAKHASLIASPARLIIPADSAQTTRLLALGPRDTERYYRVRFIPVMPQQSDDFALTEEQQSTYADSLSAGLTLLTGYGAIIVVRPAAARYETRMKDEAGEYRVHNAGNTTITLENLHDCGASGTACTPEIIRRVLPGSQISIEKNPGRTYRATLVEGLNTQVVSF